MNARGAIRRAEPVAESFSADEAIRRADFNARTMRKPYAVVDESGVIRVRSMEMVHRLRNYRPCVVLEVIQP